MDRLMGRKKKNPAPAARQPMANSTVRTTQTLKEDVKKYEQRRNFLVKKGQNEFQQAKELAAKNEKQNAAFHLKKKKLYDAEVDKLDNAVLTLEQQIMNIESASLNLDIVTSQETAEREMRRLQKILKPERIDRLMEAITDSQEELDEINDLLRENGTNFQDDDILKELDLLALDQLEEDADLEGLPITPTAVKASRVKSDEDQFRELLELQDAPTRSPIKQVKSKPIAIDNDDDQLAELEADMRA